MTVPNIAIPLKGMIDSDWVTPLRNYIATVYGPGDHFTEEINSLHRLRQDVKGCAKDKIGRDLVYKYYGQLELLDLRVPINEHSCRMSFSWIDAYTHEPTTQFSLAFEKASLLYNLACINCQVAVDTTDIKLSFNSFQAAAGIFSFIVENFLHAPSTDLSQETVKALSKLMLAQAQEAFVTRLLSDSSAKPNIVARLAKGASNLYKAAADGLQTVQSSKFWGDRAWFQYAYIKSKYYLSLSNDFYSRNLENSGKYGEAIAYLNLSSTFLQECSKMSVPSQYSDFTTVLKSDMESVKNKLTTLEKDNDFIYHTIIPHPSTLTEIAGMEAAKPTPMNELYKDGSDVSQIIGKDIFEKLIPLAVHEKSSMYSEEKAQLLRTEGEKVEIADEEMTSALEFLDLPGSLRLIKEDGDGDSSELDVPPVVNDWAIEVSNSDAIMSIQFLESQRVKIYESVRNIEQKLNAEKAEFDQMKSRYGTEWNQVYSESLSSGIFTDLQKIKQSLASGTASDNRIKEMTEPVRAEIDILRNGPNNADLVRAFKITVSATPTSGMNLLDLDTSDDENVKLWISQAEEMLRKLNKISKERKTEFAEFKDKVHKDDISSLIILNAKVPNVEDQLFKSELEKFRPYQTRLAAIVHHQKTILKNLTTVWKKVLSNESIKRKTSNRELGRAQRIQTIEKFRQAYKSWRDSKDGSQKGKEFYQQLDFYANSILSNAQQFINNRQEERSNLSSRLDLSASEKSQDRLRQQLSGLSFNTQDYHSTPPPPPKIPSYETQTASSPWGALDILNKPELPPKPQSPPQAQPQPPRQQQQQPAYHQYPQVPYASTPMQQQQQPAAPQTGTYNPYNIPSAYDPSLYGPPQQQPQHQQLPPQPPGGYHPTYSYQQGR